MGGVVRVGGVAGVDDKETATTKTRSFGYAGNDDDDGGGGGSGQLLQLRPQPRSH